MRLVQDRFRATNALTQLFASERERLVRLVKRIMGCESTAEDIAQDTFLRLNDRPVGTEDASLLFRTAQNLAIDHLRAQRVRSDYAARAQHHEIAIEPITPDASTAAKTTPAAWRQPVCGILSALSPFVLRYRSMNSAPHEVHAVVVRYLTTNGGFENSEFAASVAQ
jgi:DNA-directed RNA polymerase specialized sigma24 family protein